MATKEKTVARVGSKPASRPRRTASKAGATRRRPANAYELLGQVCKAMAAHPLNYYQGWYSCRRGDRVTPLPSALDLPANECGTAFCRAGWIVELNDGHDAQRPYEYIEPRAHELLGSDVEADERFWADVEELFYASAVSGQPGTERYVRAGVSGVRRFMRKHAARLKARQLEAVSPAVGRRELSAEQIEAPAAADPKAADRLVSPSLGVGE